MSIQHVVLELSSWKSMMGYDTKKIIQESDFMYWSGNNNQVYKTSIILLIDGLVTSGTKYQESLPSKKIDTITADGCRKLEEWVDTQPALPEIKMIILIQLAWSGAKDRERVETMLNRFGLEFSATRSVMRTNKLKLNKMRDRYDFYNTRYSIAPAEDRCRYDALQKSTH